MNTAFDLDNGAQEEPGNQGAIFQVAVDYDGRFWAAGPAGVFFRASNGWHMDSRFPEAGAAAVCCAGRVILAAGLTGNTYYSIFDRPAWQRSHTELALSPVICFAVSPNLGQDYTLLAGTQQDGVLVSRDQGRFFRPANFGLRNFSILCLAAAPAWGRREVVVAGTANGVYFSRNGGRAWSPSGLDGQVVVSLAVLPGSGNNWVILAGLENGLLYRSTDSGVSWQQVAVPDFDQTALDTGGEQAAINAIWAASESEIYAAGESGVLRSTDGGQTWRRLEGSPPAWCLVGLKGGENMPASLVAGSPDNGLWGSPDGGEHWVKEWKLD